MTPYVIQTKSGRVYSVTSKTAISAVRKVVRLGEVVVNWFTGPAPINAEVL